MILIYLTHNDYGDLNSSVSVDYSLEEEMYVYDIICKIYDPPVPNVQYSISRLERRILPYVDKHSLSIKVYINDELRIKKNNIEG